MIIVFFYESLEKKTNSNNINLRKTITKSSHIGRCETTLTYSLHDFVSAFNEIFVFLRQTKR